MIRLDDQTGGGCWLFEHAVAVGQADARDDVVAVVREAERRAADHGEWVVMTIAYEAAAAFDGALRTAPVPPAGIPFVWWQSFRERAPARLLPHGDAQVTSNGRRANVWPFPKAVEVVRGHIEAGDVYQVNVTDRFDGRFGGTPLEMYAALVGAQRCAFGAYVEMGAMVVASASPELFFRVDGTTITCRPMKGTAARRARPGPDERAGAALLASAKERAENVMIVDLLRNDLGRIARVGSVQVPELFTLERYETVWQLTSTVCAELPDGIGLTDVLAALFPCGSVTGAPKVAAMAIIDQLEADPRGIYCGAIGLLSPPGHGPRAVFSVPIRTAILDVAAGTYEYGAGGGITWSSTADDEDAEVVAKTRILTDSRRDFSLLETLRNDARGLANVTEHVDRMAVSAHWFAVPFDRPTIEARLSAIAPAPGVERVRVLLDQRGVFTIEHHRLDESPVPMVVAVDDAITRADDPFCCHKTTWRRHYDDARARHPDADDVVLVNEHGHAIETTTANLAYRIGDHWYCPPLVDGGLPGVARGLAVDAGRLIERSIDAADLHRCAELAVVNDLRGWRPARLHDDVR